MAASSRVVDRDRGWKRMLRGVELLADKSYAKVGIIGALAGGLHKPGEALTVAEIASVHEFGTQPGVIPAIPERSFIRRTFDEQREALASDAARLVALILDGKIDVEKALGILGMKLASEIKKRVTTGPEIPPPNAPSTKARKAAKGNTTGLPPRTLVDTGRMIGAVTWAVVMGGGGEDEAVNG